MIELCHANTPGHKGRSIRIWERQETPELFEDMGSIEKLVTEILELSEQDAQNNGPGRHRYELRTKQHLGRQMTLPFLLVTEEEDNNGQLTLERPDTNGQVHQQMRHNEYLLQTVLKVVGSATQSMSRQIQHLNEENQRLSIDRVQMLRRIEDSSVDQEERAISAMLAQSADARKDEVLQKVLIPMVPIILAKLASGKSANGIGNTSALASVIDKLISSLSQEQVVAMSGVLNSQQIMLLQEASIIAKANSASNEQAVTQPQAQAAAPAPAS